MGPFPEFPFVQESLTEEIVLLRTRSLGRPGEPGWGPVVTLPRAAGP